MKTTTFTTYEFTLPSGMTLTVNNIPESDARAIDDGLKGRKPNAALLDFCLQLSKRPSDYLCAEDWEALEDALRKSGVQV